ncbi:MAG: hypothetical protein JSS66_12785 [Armatimonadetes bacterium]|nr:hypothetical protein [Armatimonadota bacterium]
MDTKRMIVSSDLEQAYNRIEPALVRLRSLVRDTLLNYCEVNGLAFLSRQKALGSLSEKVESGRIATWEAVDDLVAATVVVPTLADEGQVISDLGRLFEVVDVRRRASTMKSFDVFRFDATRVIAKLSAAVDEGQALRVSSILFEVQVRSAFDHAWSVATHALVYKTDNPSWRRQRMAAQMKAVCEQMDSVLLGFEEVSAKIDESEWRRVANVGRIISTLKGLFNEGRLPEELLPKDWSRLGDNIYSLVLAHRERDRDESEVIGEAIAALKEGIEGLTGNVPRSMSLFQLSMGVLSEGDMLSKRKVGFVHMVDRYSIERFPSTELLKPRFVFEQTQ